MTVDLNNMSLRPMQANQSGTLDLRRIEFGAGDPYGPWVRSFKVGANRFIGTPTDFLRVYYFDTQTNTFGTWYPTDFTCTFTETPDLQTRTFFVQHETLRILLKLEIRTTDTGFAFRLLEVNNYSTRHSIQYVEWPRFKFLPFGSPANNYGVMPFTTGFIYKGPHTRTMFAGMPDEMQWTCMYDSASGTTVMFRFDDQQFHFKSWTCTGDGTAAEHVFKHHCDRRFQVAYPWKRDNYSLHVEAFRPSVRNGLFAPYKAAKKYRDAVRAMNPPWLMRGPWASDGTRSSVIKAMDCHITMSGGRDHALTAQNLDRLRTHCGFVSAVATIYDWSSNLGGAYTPDPGTPQSSFSTLLSSLTGWSVAIYTMLRNWSRRITNTFKLDGYSGLDGTIPADLTPYCMKDKTGVVRQTFYPGDGTAFQSGETYSNPDYSQSVWMKVCKDVARRTMAVFGGNKPGGVYFDANGTFITSDYGQNIAGTDASEFQDDPTNPGWTHKDYYSGRAAALSALKEGYRMSVASAFVFTEWPEESDIPFIDALYHNEAYAAIGVWSALFHAVYGDYVRFTAFQTPTAAGNDVSQNLSLCQIMTVSWLRSGVVTLNNALDVYPADLVLAHSPITDSPLYYMIDWMRVLRIAFGNFSDYFQGRLIMPVLDTWLSDAIQADTTEQIGWQYFLTLYSTKYLVFSEAWQKSNGDVGIFVAYCYPTSTIINQGTMLPLAFLQAAFTVFPSKTYTLSLDTTIDGLNPGLKSLYKNVAGSRTLLGTFTQSISVQITVDPWTVTLYEVVGG